MMRVLFYNIEKNDEYKSVSEFLRDKGYSTTLIRYIKNSENGFIVDGKKVFTNYKLSKNEQLIVSIADEKSSENIIPIKMDLDILYEDSDIIVINKKADLPIHPSIGNFDNTLANGLAYYFKEKNENFVFRAVNRLDRDTTGIVVLAKNRLSSCILSYMIKKNAIDRQYIAIVQGIVPDKGRIDAPIGRMPESIIERCIDFNFGERAVTNFWCIERKTDFSIIGLKLETGRTHQIRVHMKHIGFPLLGDFLYNPDFNLISRQALHSYKTNFYHPITNENLTFTAQLPNDMKI